MFLPSIHAADIVNEEAFQIDVHEHDVYYNHYRSKSEEDHNFDPLRRKMPILEARDVKDTRILHRFVESLKQRLAEGDWGRAPVIYDKASALVRQSLMLTSRASFWFRAFTCNKKSSLCSSGTKE